MGPLDEQDEDITILGFFSIAISSFQMKKEVARSIRDALGVHSKDMIISSFLIGQLAKNDSCPDKLRGADLLEYAINLILNAHDIAGGRFVRVDCSRDERLVSFYSQNGFREVMASEGFVHMVRFLNRRDLDSTSSDASS